MALEIAGACDGYRSYHADLPSDQCRIGQVASADRDVVPVLAQAYQALRYIEIDRHLGIGREELRQARHDEPAGKGREGRHPQKAAELPLANAYSRRIEVGEHPDGEFV